MERRRNPEPECTPPIVEVFLILTLFLVSLVGSAL